MAATEPRIRSDAYKGQMPKRSYGTGQLYEKSGAYYGRPETARKQLLSS
jgi:hypothetical protein